MDKRLSIEPIGARRRAELAAVVFCGPPPVTQLLAWLNWQPRSVGGSIGVLSFRSISKHQQSCTQYPMRYLITLDYTTPTCIYVCMYVCRSDVKPGVHNNILLRYAYKVRPRSTDHNAKSKQRNFSEYYTEYMSSIQTSYPPPPQNYVIRVDNNLKGGEEWNLNPGSIEVLCVREVSTIHCIFSRCRRWKQHQDRWTGSGPLRLMGNLDR